ncbi:MAG: OmpP1/FadL family transporter [Gammaproteobacteria bacterium]
MKRTQIWIFILLLFPFKLYASIIESTIGAAVINDATAAYYNPAALVLLENPQFIILGSIGDFRTKFTGQSTIFFKGLTEMGSGDSRAQYYSPSAYFAIPITDNITFGLAMMANSAFRDVAENSIQRYVQASNTIADHDIVPAIEVKINNFFSVGVGVDFSYANIHLKPINQFPGSNTADSASDNRSNGMGVGGNVGFLLKLAPSTTIGFNYRSVTNYELRGESILRGIQDFVSSNYYYKLMTPARSVLTVNHFVTPKLGLITTIQRIQWSAFKDLDVYGIASLSGLQPVILNASVPFRLRDTWVVTLGGHYRATSKWIVRLAGSYNQSPGNPFYQISNGDSVILATSMGYQINKYISIDGGYAHAFIKDQNINITSNRVLINGINEGARDVVSLKLTFNMVK